VVEESSKTGQRALGKQSSQSLVRLMRQAGCIEALRTVCSGVLLLRGAQSGSMETLAQKMVPTKGYELIMHCVVVWNIHLQRKIKFE
jgi:hypothetical protein